MHKKLYKFLEQQRYFYNLQFDLKFNISTTIAFKSIAENIQIKGSFKRYLKLFLVKIWPSLHHL